MAAGLAPSGGPGETPLPHLSQLLCTSHHPGPPSLPAPPEAHGARQPCPHTRGAHWSASPAIPVTLMLLGGWAQGLMPSRPQGHQSGAEEGRPGRLPHPTWHPWPSLGIGSCVLRPGPGQPLRSISVPITADARMRTPWRPQPMAPAPCPPGSGLSPEPEKPPAAASGGSA